MHSFIALCIVSLTMVAIDYIWLSSQKQFYLNAFTRVQNDSIQIRYVPAIICYILMIAGFMLFVKPRLYYRKTIKEKTIAAFRHGFLFGAISYGIFNMTNMAMFKQYSGAVALIDTLWGGTLFFITSLMLQLCAS